MQERSDGSACCFIIKKMTERVDSFIISLLHISLSIEKFPKWKQSKLLFYMINLIKSMIEKKNKKNHLLLGLWNRWNQMSVDHHLASKEMRVRLGRQVQSSHSRKNQQIQSNYKLEFLKKRKKVTDGWEKKHDLMEIERLNQKRSIRLSQMD